jgi:hypothetical protein
VRLLLTSGGVTNTSIRDALVDLLGKPIADSSALCIPTAQWCHPVCTPASAWRFIAGQPPSRMCDLGWKSVGVLELTALPSIGEERWIPWVREADVLLVEKAPAHAALRSLDCRRSADGRVSRITRRRTPHASLAESGCSLDQGGVAARRTRTGRAAPGAGPGPGHSPGIGSEREAGRAR